MTDTTITNIVQQINVDNITSVIATDATQDPNTQLWVRQFRIMGTVDGNTSQIFVLQISSVNETGVELTAPPSVF